MAVLLIASGRKAGRKPLQVSRHVGSGVTESQVKGVDESCWSSACPESRCETRCNWGSWASQKHGSHSGRGSSNHVGSGVARSHWGSPGVTVRWWGQGNPRTMLATGPLYYESNNLAANLCPCAAVFRATPCRISCSPKRQRCYVSTQYFHAWGECRAPCFQWGRTLGCACEQGGRKEQPQRFRNKMKMWTHHGTN